MINDQTKPEITYPCMWEYKLIGIDRYLIEQAIKEVCGDQKVSTSYSKSSSSGKYHSMNLELEVQSEINRNTFFAAFKDHKDITMVI